MERLAVTIPPRSGPVGAAQSMNKQVFSRIHPLSAAVVVVAAVLATLLGAYGLTRWASASEVMGRVSVAEAELGGHTRAESLDLVGVIETDRLTRPAQFLVDGKQVTLAPGDAGLEIDERAVVTEAMAVGREGNFANQFLHWLGHIFTTEEITLRGRVSETALSQVFDTWDSQVIARPLIPGSIELVDEELVPHYPETGIGVDREPALDVVTESFLAAEPATAEIPVTILVPELDDEDVNAALAEAQQMLSGPITLVYEGNQTVLETEALKSAFVSETMTNSPIEIVNSFDPAVVDGLITPIRSQFEAEPVNAEFVINDDNTVTVKPGANGTRIDEVETAARLYHASLSPTRTAVLPIVEGAEPEFTTEYLESLNVKHLVSQFTTYHDCCEDRVTNIHLIAEAVDGTLVLPGETFSLNGHVGERTAEKGYLPAGSIVAGEIVDTLGGGTSQFTTTMYNAVFWGGYEDVEHQPHSYYFSRYPEGIEATLFWRSIDLKFRNNREHAILIDTRYTDTSITVRFFGFNDGRTLVGEQRGGETRVRVASEGGPVALHVKGDVSERHNVTEPGDTQYRANPELGVDEQDRVQSPAEGWTVSVTRTILRGGTETVEEQRWVVRYRPQVEIIEVHPCKVPGTSVACPTTTTTTIPTTTTTQPANNGSA